MSKFEAGQRWSYKVRPQDTGSTFVVGEVTKEAEQTVVHITVEDVSLPTSSTPSTIGHMPFSESAIEASVVKLVDGTHSAHDVFKPSKETWEKEKGSVFDTTVANAIDAVFSEDREVSDPEIDDLVIAMRDQKNEGAVEKLYSHLFQLEHWFFLCDPKDDQAPVQWEFPEAQNKSPAVLAFTSEDRAAIAATELGIYPAGAEINLITPSVAECVDWMTSDAFDNEWLCFNISDQNFPFYKATARDQFNVALAESK